MRAKYLKTGIALLVLLFFALFVYHTDKEQTLSALKKIGPRFGWFMASTCLAYMLATVGWLYCFDAHTRIPLFRLFMIRHVGETVAVFNPTSVIGGETFNVLLLEPYRIDRKEAKCSEKGPTPRGAPLAYGTEDIAASDAFLMPNTPIEGDMEGFGLVCLEASMAGVVVFAAAIDGIPDAILHGKNGFLLAPAQVGEWAEQLNHLIKDPSTYSYYKEKFQQYTASHYGWDNMVRSYYQLFEMLLAKEPCADTTMGNGTTRQVRKTNPCYWVN